MEEDFWKESKVSDIVSNLKPRISYGVNGNVNGIGNYEVYGEYAQVDAKTYGGATALYNKKLLNTNLRWEQSQTFEVGLDIGFLQNRLSFYSRLLQPSDKGFADQTSIARIYRILGYCNEYGYVAKLRFRSGSESKHHQQGWFYMGYDCEYHFCCQQDNCITL